MGKKAKKDKAPVVEIPKVTAEAIEAAEAQENGDFEDTLDEPFETEDEAAATISEEDANDEVAAQAEEEAFDKAVAEYVELLKKSLPDCTDKRLSLLATLRHTAPNTRFLTALRYGEAKLLSLCKTSKGFFEMKRTAADKYYSAKIEAITTREANKIAKTIQNKDALKKKLQRMQEQIALAEEYEKALATETK